MKYCILYIMLFWIRVYDPSYHIFTSFEVDADIAVEVFEVYQSEDNLFLQARSAFIPNEKDNSFIITLSIHGYGTHSYGDLYILEKTDTTDDWGRPKMIPCLEKKILSNNLEVSFGDVTPMWHEKTETVLCTGKAFYSYADKAIIEGKVDRTDIEDIQEIAYATYDPKTLKWSCLKTINLPEKLCNGDDFFCANAGCTQRVDLSNGDILLPIRYKKDGRYVSTVIHCSYNGSELVYIEHGTTFTISEGRGLYEPSLCEYKGVYYLTMRADESAFVAKSSDGLNFGNLKEWTFSDGSILGSYNTQQHWISNVHGLYLIYTRRGANNDQIFRNRAPLFMGKIDPKRLEVLRSTEIEIMPIPKNGGDLGNFGVTVISNDEAWITASVCPKDINSKERETIVQVATLEWYK